MKFSIIIPNYNKEEYIEECLNSIKNQDFDPENYEILFIDDQSTDNSIEIAKKFSNVSVFSVPKSGAGGARNKGLDICKGDYVIFLDSDDFLYSNNVLKKLDNVITNQDIIFLGFIKDKFGDVTTVLDEETTIFEKIKSTKWLGCPTKCLKRSIIGNTRFPINRRYEDVNFTLENLCKIETYAYFNEPFFVYRKTNNSNTTAEISGTTMTDLLLEISSLYYLCFKYPKYKDAVLFRLKNDRLRLRLDILDELIETDINTFGKYF